MSLSYNHVTLAGNLTRKPELKQAGNSVVSTFSIAINRRWRNADGETQDEVTFVDCEAWGKTAEFVEHYFDKGSPIFVAGRLKLDSWEDKDGQRRSRLRVRCLLAQFCSGQRRQDGDGAVGEGADEAADEAPAPRSKKALAGSRRSAAKPELDDEFPAEEPPF